MGQRVWDSQKNVERSSKVLVWSCASGGGVTRYTPCAWPAGWGLSCPPRVAIRRTTLWCCSFSSRFSSRFPAPPKEVKVHTGTDYHSMVSECRIWPSGGQESKKKTCGSTVFSTGHPRQYSLAPAMLVCADRTRRGRFIAVWPQIRSEDSGSYRPLPKSCRQSNFRCALSRLLALPGLAQYLQDLSRPVFFSGGRRRPTQAADSPLVMLRSLWTGAPVAVGLAVHREGEGPLVVLALIHPRCPPEVL